MEKLIKTQSDTLDLLTTDWFSDNSVSNGVYFLNKQSTGRINESKLKDR